MKIAIAKLVGATEMIHGRYHDTPKLPKELADDYEKRTWGEKLHYNKDGVVVIPPLAIKNSVAEAAKYLSLQIPGKGKSTYTKHFEAGFTVLSSEISLGIPKTEIQSRAMFVPSDGVRGSGKRVMKYFPVIPAGWECEVVLGILDDILTKDVVLKHLQTSGLLIGIGSFRPRNNGLMGRFNVTSFEWDENYNAQISA